MYRFAAVLTFDPEHAADLAATALARDRPHRRADAGAAEQDDGPRRACAVVAGWLGGRHGAPAGPRDARRWFAPRGDRAAPAAAESPTDLPTGPDSAGDAPADPVLAALAGLPPRQRALVVLCTYGGVDPGAAGDPVGLTSRRVRAELRAALLALGAALRLPADGVPGLVDEALRRAAAAVAVPPGLSERTAQRAAALTRRRRRRLLAAAAAVLVLLGASAGALAVARRPPPTSVPVATGLLDWPTRGELAGDRDFREAALQRWRRTGPVRRPHPLFLGRVGEGRVALLEGLERRGPAVALVADHGPATAVVLSLDAVSRLPGPRLPLLVVPYGGNLDIPGFAVAPPAALVQALVAPWVTRLERLAPGGVFRPVPIRGGLSSTWLALPTGPDDSAAGAGLGPIRAYAGPHLVLDAAVPARGLVPVGEEPGRSVQTAAGARQLP